jgi:hypothetical protein
MQCEIAVQSSKQDIGIHEGLSDRHHDTHESIK